MATSGREPAPVSTAASRSRCCGRSASAARAVTWADGKELFWRVRLGALRDGDADELLASYTVVSQRPSPGTRLALGRS